MADVRDYHDDIYHDIFARIAKREALQSILASDTKYPASPTFYERIYKDSNLHNLYNNARLTAVLTEIDEIQQEMRDVETEFVVCDGEKSTTYGQASARIAKLDLRLKTAQWLASIIRPALFGKNAAGRFNLDANAPALEQTKQLLTAVSKGELSPADANAVKSIVQSKAELDEVKELQERITKLETNNGKE